MVFGTGINEIVVVAVALSLPVWLALEELAHRSSGPRVARRPAEEPTREARVTAAAA